MPTRAARRRQEKPTLNPELIDFWLTPARLRILYGGRSSTKSWDAAGFACFLAQRMKLKFLCVRQFQNKIEESVYTLLKEQINRFNLSSQFQIFNNRIISSKGSEFFFYGLWRNIEEIKSTEGVDILWIEEAHSLTPSQWEILEPTIRKEGSQIWIIFNPGTTTDFVWQRFVVNPLPDSVVHQINYDRNPFLSRTMLNVIEAKKSEDYEEYEHIYLGVPRDDDDSVIIKRSWLNAAVDAHIKLGFEPAGSKRIGFDIADDGGDRCVNVMAHGNTATGMDWWKANEDELMKSCERTYANARQYQSEITYDSIGVGAMAGSKFDEINQADNRPPVDYHKFRAGGEVINPDREYANGVTNKDMFSNLKAQAWWLVADRLRNTWDAVTNGTDYPEEDLISISSTIPDLEKLLTELSTPKKDYDLTGRVKVESKKDLEKREVASPDLADAFIMAFAPIAQQRGILDVLMAR